VNPNIIQLPAETEPLLNKICSHDYRLVRLVFTDLQSLVSMPRRRTVPTPLCSPEGMKMMWIMVTHLSIQAVVVVISVETNEQPLSPATNNSPKATCKKKICTGA